MSAKGESERDRVLRSVRPLHDVPAAPGWNHEELAGLIDDGPRRPAAVLVALIEREGTLSVLFTRRNDDLTQHAGQVSFPGGGVDAGDARCNRRSVTGDTRGNGVDSALIRPSAISTRSRRFRTIA